MNNRSSMFVAALLAILFCSCVDNTDRVYVVDAKELLWHKDSTLCFSMYNGDTTSMIDLNVIVRDIGFYPYNNLRMSVTTINPDSQVWCDTLCVNLSTNGNIVYADTEVAYRHNVRFNLAGEYRMCFKHLMPSPTINGVASVGIVIREKNGKR